MSEENTNPSNPQPRQQVLNLQNIATQFMQGLQRHFDMLAYNIAARGAVTDEMYNARVRAPKVMPFAQSHTNLEQLQAYSQDLLVRQVLGDSLNLATSCMGNCHFFCTLIRLQKETGGDQQAMQTQAQPLQQKFVEAPLQDKFDAFESTYSITSPVEDTIISIGLALQCLMQKNGIVSEAECDEQGELAFDLKVVEVEGEAVADQPVKGKIVEQRKVFRKGDRIDFTADELQSLQVTLAEFFQSVFRGVENYGKSQQESA